MNTTQLSSFAHWFRGTLVLLLILIVTRPVMAADIEHTVVVRPGAASVDITFQPTTTIEETHGPVHGHLAKGINSAVAHLDTSFWDTGADLVIFSVLNNDTGLRDVVRYRLVAGRTADDGIVSAPYDPNVVPPPAHAWQIDAPSVSVVQGLLTPYAFELAGVSSPRPSMTVAIGDSASGHATTTSTTDVGMEVEDIPGEWLPNTVWPFYQILEGSTPIVNLLAHYTAAGWSVQLVSATGQSGPLHPLEFGHNRLRLVRWDDAVSSRAGVDLYVNRRFGSEVDTVRYLGNMDEHHDILMPVVPGPTNQQLVIDQPRAARSENVVDPTTRLRYDDFSGGPDASWTTINGGPLGFASQDLPGSGDRLEVDLGQTGADDTAMLEAPVAHTPGGANDPPGFSMRLWLDPTNVTMPTDTSVRIATACTEGGNCGAARIWLGYDGTSYTIAATAWRDGSPGARIEVPVTNEPHTVQVKLNHGWLPGLANGSVELWIDNQLAGTVTGLDNHASQIAKVRLGVMRDVGGSAGIIGLDDYEAWHFD